MSAPLIWIGVPLLAAGAFLLFARTERGAAIGGGTLALVLCLLAIFLPVDTAISIQGISFRVDSAMPFLGRRFLLPSSDQLMLTLVYGIAAAWFYGAIASGIARRVVSLGFAITALLVSSLAVEPFLYAALLIEMAVLVAVPLLSPPDQPPGRGVLRFVVFQTLAMPFILLAGFLLSGVESSPGDLALVRHAAALLALGFAFLLAIFPFYVWIPLLCEEAHPYAVAFVLLFFPTMSLFFALGFLDRYSFLRDAADLPRILALAGLVMVLSGGLWAAFQRHIARLMGYAVILEIGLSVIAISLAATRPAGLGILFVMVLPRALALLVWSLALTSIRNHAPSMRFADLRGLARRLPFSSLGVTIGALTLAGGMLLASFPVRLALLEQAAVVSRSTALWIGVGILGLFVGALRTLAVFVMAPTGSPWESLESGRQKVAITAGVTALFVLGIFPQWVLPLVNRLPQVFQHLGK